VHVGSVRLANQRTHPQRIQAALGDNFDLRWNARSRGAGASFEHFVGRDGRSYAEHFVEHLGELGAVEFPLLEHDALARLDDIAVVDELLPPPRRSRSTISTC